MAQFLTKGKMMADMMPQQQAQPGAQPQPANASADQMQQEMTAAFGGDGQVSPEEQAQSDRLVINGMNLIYDQKTRGGILKSLDGNGDPIDGLAATAVMVWQHLLKSADQNGFKASGDALMNAAREIFEHLADYSTKAGLHDFAQDPDAVEGAYFRALDDIRVVLQKEGRLDPEVAKQDMGRLEEMDKSGQLEQVMMSQAERDQQRGQPPQEQQEPAQDAPRGLGAAMGGK